MYKKILITGAKGMLGTALCPLLEKYNILSIDKDNCDITDKSSLINTIGDFEFDAVVHCAAYTNVDKAEEESQNAFKVNTQGTANVACALKSKDCLFIYISTDYVFDGKKESLYTEKDATNPLGVYGKSKLEGENIASGIKKHLIIRTSWLFGPNGKNFVSTIAKAAKEKDALSVVDDQTGSPTYTLDLAKAISDILDIHFKKTIEPGIYNITNTGFCSWFELADYIVKESGLKTTLKPIKSEQLTRPAKRPKNSMLSKEKFKNFLGYYLPTWQEAVSHYLKNYVLKGRG
ncbi:MAG: dTDP-4-dehydrorhamnose reductase [Candidatus Omnitrophota bacterium]